MNMTIDEDEDEDDVTRAIYDDDDALNEDE